MDSLLSPNFILTVVVALAISIYITVRVTNWINSWRNRTRTNADPILSGHVSLIFIDGRCTRIVDDGADYQLANGESRQPLNLQDRGFPLEPHPCYTADNARIRVTAYAVWSISNIRDLLRSASLSDESLRATVQMAIVPELANVIAGYKLADINSKRIEIAQSTQGHADVWLKRYGLSLHKIAIHHIQFPDPPQTSKPDGHKEAERLSTLDGVVPKVDEKTLYYARQMRELELANAKELRSEKKS